MPIDPEQLWKQRFNDLPKDGGAGGSWATQVAKATDEGVTNKLQLSGITGQVTFTFQKAIFENLIKLAVPAPSAFPGAQAIATAWKTATLASVIVVAPGAFIGSPAPPTTFSVVISSVIDPPSVAAGYSTLFTLLTTVQGVSNGLDNIIGPALRKAFSLLTVTVTGIDSTPPPNGPLPLVAPLTPVM